MFKLVDLREKHIVVTGASRGIGRETAILCSRLGARVTCAARNEAKLQETVSLLEGEGHGYLLMDFENIENINAFAADVVETYGPVDGLVHAAGISMSRPLNVLSPAIIEHVIRIDLISFIELVKCFSKRNRYNKNFRIVGISSIAAFHGNKTQTVYAAAKAGINGAMRCMALELAEKGIAVNTVAPAMIATDMYKGFLEQRDEEERLIAQKRLLSQQYLGIGKTEDVAAAIAFLLSPAARFITGICLPVDGGSLSH